MSTVNETPNDHLQTSTPSRLANETPNWVRVVGLIGMAALGLSVLMYAYNYHIYVNVIKGPSLPASHSSEDKVSVYPSVLVWFLFIFGIILMLVQASRERDKIQRRMLGLIGTTFFCLGTLFLTFVLSSEAIKNLITTNSEQTSEAAAGRGNWAGLGATIIMAFILLSAWIAPFVRSAAGARVSLLGLGGAWIKHLGQPLVAACTMYGAIGLGVMTAIAFFLKDPLSIYCTKILQYSAENMVPYGLGSYAILFMLVGIPFMLVMANKEEDEAWERMPTSILGVVGVVVAFVGMIGFCRFDAMKVPDYLLPYGFVLSLMGLFFISLFVSQRDDDSNAGVTVARWTAYTGLVVLLIAALRSVLPSITEIGWLQDMFPSLEDRNLSSYLVPNGFIYMLLGGLYLFVGRLFCSESKLLIMTRRELAIFFSSPIGYIVLGATFIVAWYVFQEWVGSLADSTNFNESIPEPVVLDYFLNWWIIIYILIALPMLTMRLMSEENRAGTVETMLTAPVDEFSIVMSKFLAGWLYTVLIFLSWAIYPVLLRIAGQESFDYRPLLSAFFGLSLVAFGFVAMGLFFSSITKNQIVALLLTFAVILGCLAIFFVESVATASSDRGGKGLDANLPIFVLLRYTSFIHHVRTFAQGKVEFKQILFHLSFGAFWLFLTIRVLESRKWR